ncbi:MAG: hypothetical protein CVU57_06995 [Deltaproteobacteria bacterium HGW-Deltaproteobacteria-15]|jgi:hypothetical protein|nr:MAG: hypothetical protein CVU57_06995 [Deltaproteobacteria bacterium HGW-Deltaproteobacteria-15]
MYEIMKSTSKMLAIFSVLVLVFGASVNAQTMDSAMDRTVAPTGVAVNELVGMEVRTHTGEEIASVDDVILADDRVMEVVLDYEGDLVAVPIQDLRFTNRDYVIYEGTRSDLDAARDRYVYGAGPFVYPRAYSGYYGADVRYGSGLRSDRDMSEHEFVFSGPDRSDAAYGAKGYGAELRYGDKLDRDAYYEDEEYVSDDYRRGYYDRPYSDDYVHGEGYGARLRYGSNLDRNRDMYTDERYTRDEYVRGYDESPRQYYGADVSYGSGLRSDRAIEGESFVYSGPDTGNDLSYGARGYGADVRYGDKLDRDTFAEEDEGYISEERGYYSRDDDHVYSGPDSGDTEYGFEGYGAELRFGPK